MKYKKYILFLTITFLWLCIPQKTLAMDTVDYVADYLCRPNYTILGKNTPVDLTTTIKVYKKNGDKNWLELAYCTGGYIGNELTYAPVGGIYNDQYKNNMTGKGNFLPAGILYLINNDGINYNYDKSVNCGTNTSYSRNYYITQIAVWKYLKDSGFNVKGISNINSDYKKTDYAEQIEKKVQAAKKKEYSTPEIDISSSENSYFTLTKDGYYESPLITIKNNSKDNGVGKAALNTFDIIMDKAPIGTKVIVNNSELEKLEGIDFSKVNSFKIRIPKESATSFLSKIELSVKGHFTIKKAYEVGTSNNKYQPIVLVGNFPDEATNTVIKEIDTIPDCNNECHGGYSCSMNYCDKYVSDNDTERRECIINKCKISVPSLETCSSTKPNSPNTTCSAKSNSTNKTCTNANLNTFYSVSCAEQNNITYSTSLPTTIESGKGFWYSLTLNGRKQCTTTFSGNRWNFEYIAGSTATRGKLITKLNNYINLSSSNVSNYKYNSSNASIKMTVNETIKGTSEKNTTVKQLKNYSNKTVKNITKPENKGTNIFVAISDNKTYFTKKYFESEMESIYTLPEVCIDDYGDTKEDYYIKNYDGTYSCKKNTTGPYNKFYTSKKAINAADTNIEVKKDGNVISKNNCNYTIGSLFCVISKEGNKYKIQAISNHKLDYSKLKYSLSTSSTIDDFQHANLSTGGYEKTFNPKSTIYGKVSNGTNVVTCTLGTCPTSIKTTDYKGMSDYCSKNWKKANFDNANHCYNTCATRKCRLEIQSGNYDKYENYAKAVKGYCSGLYGLANDEYGKCMTECLDINDYVYRPISLSDPFPNRGGAIGANWFGYEHIIANSIEKVNKNEPEYAIKLSANDILKIKNDNKKTSYTDYEWASGSSGKYKSKFIHETYKKLFTVRGGK